MFDSLLKPEAADRPCEEFERAESVLKEMHLPAGGWRFGARLVEGNWRTIVRIDSLGYDIALPPVFPAQEGAVAYALQMSHAFGGVPRAPGGDA